jgi:hypothetical protein
MLEIYVVNYDIGIPKDSDVSDIFNNPNPGVSVGIQEAHDLGFERLGEVHSYAGLATEPQIAWIMHNPIGDVTLSLGHAKHIKPYFAQFETWFEDNSCIITSYPLGAEIKSNDLLETAIATSLEAAYNFHLRQVALFADSRGSTIIVDSIREHLAYSLLYRQLHAKMAFKQKSLNELFTAVGLGLFAAPIIYCCIAFLNPTHFPLLSEGLGDMASSFALSLIYVIVGVLVMKKFGNFGRDISKAKKKEA